MLTKKITDLPAATAVNPSDIIPIVQGGVTKKATAAQIDTSENVRLGQWNASVNYLIDQQVSFQGDIYTALTNNINKQPNTNPSDWELFAPGSAGVKIPEYSATNSYSQDETVSYLGIHWKSLQNSNLGNTPTDGGTWWKPIPDINSKTEKTSVSDNDLVLIEDSADTNKKKKQKVSVLRSLITAVALTAEAATDLLITAASGQDITMKLGDAAGVNKFFITDSGDAEQMSFDSDGKATIKKIETPLITSPTGVSLALEAPADQSISFKLGDTIGGAQISIFDSSDEEKFRFLSNGNAQFDGDLDLDGALKTINIDAEAGNNLNIKLGDLAGVNKVSFKDSSDAEQASIDSDGNGTFNSLITADINAPAASDININTIAGKRLDIKLLASSKISIRNVADVERASIDDQGIGIFYELKSAVLEATTGVLNIVAAASEDILLKLGDTAGSNKLIIGDSTGTEVASIDTDGNGEFATLISGELSAPTGVDLNIIAAATKNIILKLGDAIGSNKLSITDSGDVEQALINSDGTAEFNKVITPEITAPASTALEIIAATNHLSIDLGDNTGNYDLRIRSANKTELVNFKSNGPVTFTKNLSFLSYTKHSAIATPVTLSDGMTWFDISDDKFKFRQNGSTVELGGGGGANIKAGTIKSATSVDGDFTDVQDWQGTGPYTSNITHGYTLTNKHKVQFWFADTNGDIVEPTNIRYVSTTVVQVTMPVNGDLEAIAVG